MEGDGWIALLTEERIDLEKTLFSGQVFSFRRTDAGEYTGAVGECVVSLLQDGDRVLYKKLWGAQDQDEVRECVSRLLGAEIRLEPLLRRWGVDADGSLVGLRPVRYDVIPTIFSFISSSNNNISRITKMVGFLYSKGEHVMRYKGVDFHMFPGLERLVGIEKELRANGFGYRSEYVCGAARRLMECGGQVDAAGAREMLLSIKGVGDKIADCILLIGMGDLSVVPVDTHIFGHSRRSLGISARSLSKETYRRIQGVYRERFGEYAGIAQLYVFKRMVDARGKR